MRIPLHANLDSRDGTLTKSPFLRNGYALKDGDGKIYVEKRPGLRLYDALGAAAGRGLVTFIDPNTKQESLFPITGSTIYQSVDSINTTIVAQTAYNTDNEFYSFWLAGQDGHTNLDYRMQSTGFVHFGGYVWAVYGYQTRAGYGTPGQYGYSAQSDQLSRQFVYYSPDNGIHWNAAVDVSGSGSYPSARNCCVLSFNNKLWIIGGYTGSALRDVWSSPDGVNWTQVVSAVSNWTSGNTALRVCVHDGKMYALVGQPTGVSASVYDGVCHSTDGITWTFTANKPWTTTSPASNSSLGHMLSAGGNLIITQVPRASGQHKFVYSADDGENWTTTDHAASVLSSSSSQTGVINGWKVGGTVWIVYISQVPGSTWGVTLAYTNNGVSYTVVSQSHGLSGVNFNKWVNKARGSGTMFEPNNPALFTADGPIWPSVDYNSWPHTPPIDGNARYDTPVQLGALASDPVLVSLGTVVGSKFDAQQVYDLTSMMIKSTTAGYVLDTVNFTLSQISDADYPSQTVRGLVYMNGIFYVMDRDGTIWGSEEDDPTSWTAVNFVSAEFEPDGGVAIAKLDSYLVAFGNYTTEQFWDAGNATGSTLSPVTSTPLLVGCANGDSLQEAEGALIWTAQAKGSGQGYLAGKFIAQLQGNNLSRISTPSVDKILEADGLSDVDSCVVAKNGQTFYLLSLHTSGVTLVYHLQAKRWYPWTQQTAGSNVSVSSITRSRDIATVITSGAHGFSTGDPVEVSGANQSGYNKVSPVVVIDSTTFTYRVDDSTVSPATGTIVCQKPTAGEFSPAFSCNFQGMQLVLGAGDGNVYEFDADTYEDNGEFIDFRPRTDKWDGQSERGAGSSRKKFVGQVEVIGDKIASDVYLRWSDDDFSNWSGWRRMDASLNRTRTHRLGDFRRRSYELLHTGNVRARFEGLEQNPESGV